MQVAADDVERALRDHHFAAWHFRSIVTRLLRIFQAALLVDVAIDEPELGGELRAAADLVVAIYLDPGYRMEDDPTYPGRIAEFLGADR
jgi:hypothetical protein